MEWKKGMLAVSKAGHDKDSWYVVLKIEGNYAYLVNGKTKTLEKPKKKKLMHLQPVNRIPEQLQEKMDNGRQWIDEDVKRALRLVKKD